MPALAEVLEPVPTTARSFPGIKCEAFEVYVDSPPATGNCYLFTSTKGSFTDLGAPPARLPPAQAQHCAALRGVRTCASLVDQHWCISH